MNLIWIFIYSLHITYIIKQNKQECYRILILLADGTYMWIIEIKTNLVNLNIEKLAAQKSKIARYKNLGPNISMCTDGWTDIRTDRQTDKYLRIIGLLYNIFAMYALKCKATLILASL